MNGQHSAHRIRIVAEEINHGGAAIRENCPACGLDYSFADPADGPAFFAMSAIGILATLAIGGVAFARGGRGAGMWAGLVAGVIALAGWGSWLVLWTIDTGRGGAVINIWGILLPGLAVLVYLVAAVLPSSAGRKAR